MVSEDTILMNGALYSAVPRHGVLLGEGGFIRTRPRATKLRVYASRRMGIPRCPGSYEKVSKRPAGSNFSRTGLSRSGGRRSGGGFRGDACPRGLSTYQSAMRAEPESPRSVQISRSISDPPPLSSPAIPTAPHPHAALPGEECHESWRPPVS